MKLHHFFPFICANKFSNESGIVMIWLQTTLLMRIVIFPVLILVLVIWSVIVHVFSKRIVVAIDFHVVYLFFVLASGFGHGHGHGNDFFDDLHANDFVGGHVSGYDVGHANEILNAFALRLRDLVLDLCVSWTVEIFYHQQRIVRQYIVRIPFVCPFRPVRLPHRECLQIGHTQNHAVGQNNNRGGHKHL